MKTLLNARRVALPLLVLAVTALSVSPAAADGPKHDLFERVQEQVLRYSFFTVFDNINVEIADEGHVVLTGHVTAEHKAKTIGERVDAVEGVTVVTNEIAVLPVSRSTTGCGTSSPARSTEIPTSGTTPLRRIRRSTSW